jgi:hypothetical protein
VPPGGGRPLEEGHLCLLWRDAQLEPCSPGQRVDPRAARQHHRVGADLALAGRHARHPAAVRQDPGHRDALADPRAEVDRPRRERERRRHRVGIAGLRLDRRQAHTGEVELGMLGGQVGRLDQLGLHTEPPQHGDVPPHALGLVRPDQHDDASRGEPAPPADPVAPVLEPGQARQGQPRLRLVGVVHPDQRARPGGHAGAHGPALDHQYVHAPLGQVEGDRAAHHASPDNDHARPVAHVLSLASPPAQVDRAFSG